MSNRCSSVSKAMNITKMLQAEVRARSWRQTLLINNLMHIEKKKKWWGGGFGESEKEIEKLLIKLCTKMCNR